MNLAIYDNREFDRGAPRWKETLWVLVRGVVFLDGASLAVRVARGAVARFRGEDRPRGGHPRECEHLGSMGLAAVVAPSQSSRTDSSAAFLFFNRWEPGTSTILRARSHRPDICLLNVGWRQTGDFGVRKYPICGRSSLPFRHFAFLREAPWQRTAYAHSFFCMQEDEVSPAHASGRSFGFTEDQRTSDWMVRDGVRVVFEGLRKPRGAVQLVIGQSETCSADAEADFARLLPEIAAVDITTRER